MDRSGEPPPSFVQRGLATLNRPAWMEQGGTMQMPMPHMYHHPMPYPVMPGVQHAVVPPQKMRKPYTRTKEKREAWTTKEHEKFVDALKLYQRDWKKIEEHVGTRNVLQIRSHAQKYFKKLAREKPDEFIPPQRAKRKTTNSHAKTDSMSNDGGVLAPHSMPPQYNAPPQYMAMNPYNMPEGVMPYQAPHQHANCMQGPQMYMMHDHDTHAAGHYMYQPHLHDYAYHVPPGCHPHAYSHHSKPGHMYDHHQPHLHSHQHAHLHAHPHMHPHHGHAYSHQHGHKDHRSMRSVQHSGTYGHHRCDPEMTSAITTCHKTHSSQFSDVTPEIDRAQSDITSRTPTSIPSQDAAAKRRAYRMKVLQSTRKRSNHEKERSPHEQDCEQSSPRDNGSGAEEVGNNSGSNSDVGGSGLETNATNRRNNQNRNCSSSPTDTWNETDDPSSSAGGSSGGGSSAVPPVLLQSSSVSVVKNSLKKTDSRDLNGCTSQNDLTFRDGVSVQEPGGPRPRSSSNDRSDPT
mmetsp:Transcript_162/g.494  ORF Transcript_162/g.494 Transcript_162/m.494 type:complete len:515 (+) Transcript_162:46-1590(+)